MSNEIKQTNLCDAWGERICGQLSHDSVLNMLRVMIDNAIRKYPYKKTVKCKCAFTPTDFKIIKKRVRVYESFFAIVHQIEVNITLKRNDTASITIINPHYEKCKWTSDDDFSQDEKGDTKGMYIF